MQPFPDTDQGHSQRGLFNDYQLLIESVLRHRWFREETVTSPRERGRKVRTYAGSVHEGIPLLVEEPFKMRNQPL